MQGSGRRLPLLGFLHASPAPCPARGRQPGQQRADPLLHPVGIKANKTKLAGEKKGSRRLDSREGPALAFGGRPTGLAGATARLPADALTASALRALDCPGEPWRDRPMSAAPTLPHRAAAGGTFCFVWQPGQDGPPWGCVGPRRPAARPAPSTDSADHFLQLQASRPARPRPKPRPGLHACTPGITQRRKARPIICNAATALRPRRAATPLRVRGMRRCAALSRH